MRVSVGALRVNSLPSAQKLLVENQYDGVAAASSNGGPTRRGPDKEIKGLRGPQPEKVTGPRMVELRHCREQVQSYSRYYCIVHVIT